MVLYQESDSQQYSIGIQGDEAAKSRMSGEVIFRNVWTMNDHVFMFIFYFS